MFRTSISRALLAPGLRSFSTTSPARKSVLESAKDAVKGVDQKVSDAAVKGIEKGERASQSIKSTVADKTQGARAEASEKLSEASGKTSELQGEAKGKAHEAAGQAKAVKEEVKQKL